MTGLQLIASAAVIVAIWIIGTFYWLRLAASALLLIAWGVITVAAPLYLFQQDLQHGRPSLGFATIAVSLIPGYLFAMALRFAADRVRRDLRNGVFWQRWNARD